MKPSAKIKAGNHQASARVVDGKLILSLPHALTPVVWQMDLGQAKASALEVTENKSNGNAVLSLKTPGGGATEIAPFETRAHAVEALMTVSRALEGGAGRIRPFATAPADPAAAPVYNPAKPRSAGKWIAAALAVLLLLVLVNIWGAMLPRAPGGLDNASPISSAPQASSLSAGQNGVPLSADDFLNDQQTTGTQQ